MDETTTDDLFDAAALARQIADAEQLNQAAIKTAIELLEAGNTLPFIARYRKEATQGLDETALRAIEDALARARDLAARKKTVLSTIQSQNALSDQLRKQILACDDRDLLENIYLPFKPKRRTKSTIAREQGLEPLADLLLKQERIGQSKRGILQSFVDPAKGVEDIDAAFLGASHIVAESWSEDVQIREWLFAEAIGGRVVSKVKRGKKETGQKFEMYFDYSESIRRVASHRLLAIKRGESEGILRVSVELNDNYFLPELRRRLVTNRDFEFHQELCELVEETYRTHLLPASGSHWLSKLKEQSDEEAIGVFASNLRELLLSPPAGKKVTIGLDPGFRTGCKLAVVDETGKFLANRTIFPTAPKNDVAGATKTLLEVIKQYDVQLIAVGNGTASRETDAFASKVIKDANLDITKVVVSESGASIYSASELAVAEYPDLDVTVRGAISIAHRLQDPLAELVKIDARSIGVGQYQHDVNQARLQKSLAREVESCVNSVGVELNTASSSLLSYVSGIGEKLASRIVQHRNENGSFKSRKELMAVPKLGKKVFTQAAGFLRIADGLEPLDNSAVHPECYYLVSKMAKDLSVETRPLVGNETLATRLKPADFVDEKYGLPTIEDIFQELTKPGRDPRSEFRAVKFDDAVNKVSDLREGMILQGQVTNVTNFGAFVDVGVHQDGLVHVSQLAIEYVSDPATVVSVGDIVRVKVLQVDEARNRIGLSIKQA